MNKNNNSGVQAPVNQTKLSPIFAAMVDRAAQNAR